MQSLTQHTAISKAANSPSG